MALLIPKLLTNRGVPWFAAPVARLQPAVE
jgi:hypothetical protein